MKGLFNSLYFGIRFAFRSYRRRPSVLMIPVVGLGSAIAVASVVFGLLQGMVVRSGDWDAFATAFEVRRWLSGGSITSSFSYAEYEALRPTLSAVELTAWGEADGSLGEPGQTDILMGFVSGNFFQALNTRAHRGRVLGPQDDVEGQTSVGVVTHAFWKHRLAANADVVDWTTEVNGVSLTVVGVLDESFMGLPGRGVPAIWVPLAIADRFLAGSSAEDLRLSIVGRPTGQHTVQQAQEEIRAALEGFQLTSPGAPEGDPVGIQLRPLADIPRGPGARAARLTIGVTMAILVILLVLASANLANVLLADAITRRREVGIRVALGASRWKVAQQLLMESFVLAFVSGAIGLLLARPLLPLTATFVQLPWMNYPRLDPRFLAFTFTFTALGGILAGLAPIRYAVNADVASSLKSATPTGRFVGKRVPTREILVGLQSATAIALVLLAALLVQAVMRASRYTSAIDADHLLTISADLIVADFDPLRASDYWDDVIRRLDGVPNIERVALVSYLPLGDSFGRIAQLPLETGYQPVYLNYSSAGFFATSGIAILQGRDYSSEEVRSGADVALISDGLARKLFGEDGGLGATLEGVSPSLAGTTVVGIVENVPTRLVDASADTIYLPLTTTRGDGVILTATLVVRASGDPKRVQEVVRSALRTVEPTVPLVVQEFRDAVADGFRRLRLNIAAAGYLGSLALVLGCVGVFSMTVFSIEQRRGEIAIRLAVGADAGRIMRFMMLDCLRPVVIGMAFGLGGAAAGATLLTAVLYGVSPHDPVATGGAVLALLVSAAVAAGLASRRSARVEPMEILEKQ